MLGKGNKTSDEMMSLVYDLDLKTKQYISEGSLQHSADDTGSFSMPSQLAIVGLWKNMYMWNKNIF